MSEVNRRQAMGALASVAGGLAVSAGGALADEKHEELPTFRFAMEQQRGQLLRHSAHDYLLRRLQNRRQSVSPDLANESLTRGQAFLPNGLRQIHYKHSIYTKT